MWKKVFLCLVMVAFLAGSGVWASHHEGDFEKIAEKWQAAYNSGDLEAVAGMYMKEGMRMPPDMPTVKGREAILAQLEGGMEAGLAKVQIETVETKIQGDTGHARGTFVGMDAEGNTITKGKWANSSQMIDGEWQIYYDIFNYDAPMPAPE